MVWIRTFSPEPFWRPRKIRCAFSETKKPDELNKPNELDKS